MEIQAVKTQSSDRNSSVANKTATAIKMPRFTSAKYVDTRCMYVPLDGNSVATLRQSCHVRVGDNRTDMYMKRCISALARRREKYSNGSDY